MEGVCALVRMGALSGTSCTRTVNNFSFSQQFLGSGSVCLDLLDPHLYDIYCCVADPGSGSSQMKWIHNTDILDPDLFPY